MIGKTISHYRILEKLGAGGMGIVYKAQDLRLDRFVVLKFLPSDLTRDEKAKERFIVEAKAASALDHPNVCTIYEIDETDEGHLFIAMAYYEGETLKEKVSSNQLSVISVVEIATQIAQGLARAHEAGIVHRDIKPANIIITKRNEVKILDFGLAKLAGQQHLTQSGATLGTIAYMSPEQAQGLEVDHRTDIWSLGVVMYEMLTGQLPFQGHYDQAVMYAIVNSNPRSIRTLQPNVPEEWECIVHKALRKKVAERFQSVTNLLTDLQAFREGRKVTQAVTHSPKKWFRLALLAAVVVLALITGFAAITRLNNIKVTESQDSGVHISPNRVVVLPFAVHGSSEVAYLANGMMDLLSIKLDGVGAMRRVDPYVLQSYIKRELRGELDLERSRSIAQHFGAGLYVVGSVFKTGEQIQLTASLYDVNTGLQQAVETKAMEDGQIFVLIDDLARQLLATHGEVVKNRMQRLAAITTNSAAALKAYLEGEAQIRAGQYKFAVDAFQRAVQDDTSFALAYYRMAYAQSITPQTLVDYQYAIKQALRYSQRLPKRDLDSFNALRYLYDGQAKMSEKSYRQIVNDYPDDWEAWFHLGEILVNYSPRQGRPTDEARLALNRALALDPENPIVVGFLQWLALIDHNLVDVDSLTVRRLQLSPKGDYALWSRAIVAFLRQDESAQLKIVGELNQAAVFKIWFAIGAVADIENFSGAKTLAGLLMEPSRSTSAQTMGHAILARVYLAQGSLAAAEAELALTERLHPTYPIEESTLFRLTPLAPLSHNELRRQLEKNAVWADDKIMTPVQKNYTSGHLHAHLGEYAIAEANAQALDNYAMKLERQKVTSQPIAMAQDLAHSIRAEVFWKRGDPSKALAELEQMWLEGWWSPVPNTLIDSQAHERYLRAQILTALGRYEDAIFWLSTLGNASIPEIIYRAPKHFLLGEIYDAIKQPDKAILHYSRFVGLWKNCDPELRPKVEEAQKRLAQLRMKSGLGNGIY